MLMMTTTKTITKTVRTKKTCSTINDDIAGKDDGHGNYMKYHNDSGRGCGRVLVAVLMTVAMLTVNTTTAMMAHDDDEDDDNDDDADGRR
jgi:hypothetical protein